VLDDHTRWRAPLVAAAERLRMLAVISLASWPSSWRRS
jgi:hypothetical protein